MQRETSYSVIFPLSFLCIIMKIHPKDQTSSTHYMSPLLLHIISSALTTYFLDWVGFSAITEESLRNVIGAVVLCLRRYLLYLLLEEGGALDSATDGQRWHYICKGESWVMYWPLWVTPGKAMAGGEWQKQQEEFRHRAMLGTELPHAYYFLWVTKPT